MLLEGLQSLSDEDTLVSFDDFARSLLMDPDSAGADAGHPPAGRIGRHKAHPRRSFRILTDDKDTETRAEAATALGKFVELGRVGRDPRRIPGDRWRTRCWKRPTAKTSLLVRRNALEALGFSSRPEVITLIESAFRRRKPRVAGERTFCHGALVRRALGGAGALPHAGCQPARPAGRGGGRR